MSAVTAPGGPAQASQDEDLRKAVANLIKAKGRYHTEQNFTALVSAYGAALAAQSAPQQAACVWKPAADNWETGTWDSGCGESWVFMEGGPAENSVRYCQGCGKPVVVAAAPSGETLP